MPFRCERLPDRFPIASAAVQLSDLLAFIVESPFSAGHSWAVMNFKLKEGKLLSVRGTKNPSAAVSVNVPLADHH